MKNSIATIRLYTICACIASLLLVGCGDDSGGPSTTEKALEELQSKYDELTQKEIELPVKWAAEDLENVGDWDYLVQEISNKSPLEFEVSLNELGNERWEVFWIEPSNDGYLVMLKRPSVSYLSKIPFSQIGRFVIGNSGTEN